jgi:hypothetical protein
MIKTNNPVARNLEQLASVSPFVIERENYRKAAQEIHYLQSKLDEKFAESSHITSYPGDPWHADESENSFRLFRGSLQILKASKQSESVEPYWPEPDMIQFMLDALNSREVNSK